MMFDWYIEKFLLKNGVWLLCNGFALASKMIKCTTTGIILIEYESVCVLVAVNWPVLKCEVRKYFQRYCILI